MPALAIGLEGWAGRRGRRGESEGRAGTLDDDGEGVCEAVAVLEDGDEEADRVRVAGTPR